MCSETLILPQHNTTRHHNPKDLVLNRYMLGFVCLFLSLSLSLFPGVQIVLPAVACQNDEKSVILEKITIFLNFSCKKL
jgi:hypothetical protein